MDLRTNMELKINRTDCEIVGDMNVCLESVMRFAKVKEIPYKQSVSAHVGSLGLLIDKFVVHDDQLQERLTMMALFHDLGELLGEDVNKDEESMIANYFFYIFSKYRFRRCIDELNRLRRIKKDLDTDKDSIINYFEERDENVTKHLFDIYKYSTGKDTPEQVLFNFIDKLDGLTYYVENRDVNVETSHDLAEWRAMYEILYYELEKSQYKETHPHTIRLLLQEMDLCLKKLY